MVLQEWLHQLAWQFQGIAVSAFYMEVSVRIQNTGRTACPHLHLGLVAVALDLVPSACCPMVVVVGSGPLHLHRLLRQGTGWMISGPQAHCA